MTTPIPLHPRPQNTPHPPPQSPLPPLLQTPLGLALLELQGEINFPDTAPTPDSPTTTTTDTPSDQGPGVLIGRLTFPDYVEGTTDTAWMKRVYLFIGENQRLGGEVKKLPKAVGVVRRRGGGRDGEDLDGEGGGELEVVEIVKYKICFMNRPEPVEGGEEVRGEGEGGMDIDG